MKTKRIGNLLELAEKQILSEISNGRRKIKWHTIKIGEKELIRPYKISDLLNYAIILRKQLDRYGRNGEILKVKNIKTKQFVELEGRKEVRHRKYLREQEGR